MSHFMEVEEEDDTRTKAEWRAMRKRLKDRARSPKLTDKERLDFLTERGRDGFTSLKWEVTDFGELRRVATQPPAVSFDDPRQAIDAAIRADKASKKRGKR